MPEFEYAEVNIKGIPRFKKELAAYYGYEKVENFIKSNMALAEEEFKRLKIPYNKNLFMYTPKQTKVIVGILGRLD